MLCKTGSSKLVLSYLSVFCFELDMVSSTAIPTLIYLQTRVFKLTKAKTLPDLSSNQDAVLNCDHEICSL